MSGLEAISEKDWELIRDGLVRGEYHLLTGAGINGGCLGGDGNAIPTSAVLTKELISDFNLDTGGEAIGLGRAYENIENRRAKYGRSVNQYFKFRFSNCRPDWQSLVFYIPWRRIWTLNIDDVLENAFKNYINITKSKKSLAYYTWSDRFDELGRERDAVQVVHLHGFADCTDNLVFSIGEYLRVVNPQKTWHPVFGDEYQSDPFIIIGARIRDE